MERKNEPLVVLLLAVSSLLAVVSNALVLLVFFKRRGLRTVSNRFVINLLVANLLSSVLLSPLLILDQNYREKTDVSDGPNKKIENILIDEKHEKVYGTKLVETENIIEIDILDVSVAPDFNFVCYFARAVTTLACTASIFSILLIGIDQYFAVIHALRYHSYIDKFKSSVLLLSCWILSITISVSDLLVSPDSMFWKFCDGVDTKTRTKLKTLYSVLYFVVVILGPFVTICLIYFRIYFAARQNSERMRKSTSANLNPYVQLPVNKESDESLIAIEAKIPKVRSAPNMTNLDGLDRTETNNKKNRNIIVSLKTKISNASVFRYREETRAARISILVIFMVLICYVPYGVAMMLNRDDVRFNRTSMILLVSSNLISPFLFAYRNRRIRRELVKLLRCKGRSEGTDVSRRIVRSSSLKAIATPPEIEVEEPSSTFDEPKQKSILKRVCSKGWSYKKCNFMTVPESCLDARGSFSSASTQISTDE